MSKFKFRQTRQTGIDATFAIRGSTRENPVSRADLAATGITPASVREKFTAGEYVGWVCEAEGKLGCLVDYYLTERRGDG